MNEPLTVILEPAEEGGFTATIAEIPGAVSEGETKEEAIANVMDALAELMAYRRERALASAKADAIVAPLPRPA